MVTILILGAGMVSGPVIQTLQEHDLIVADKIAANIEEQVGKVKGLQVKKAVGTLEEGFMINNVLHTIVDIVRQAELVISLLPPTMHPLVARICLEENKHLITASYTSLEMQSLHEQAAKKDIMLINECGLDPGIDHMSAMQLINEIKEKGGKITGFESYCGGLPSNKENNLMQYQFSWSPLGVLRAGKSSALYLKNNKKETINAGELFKHYFPLEVENETFEAYYNRNSLQYLDTYDLSSVETFIRGTIRYPGWCDTLQAINNLHLLEEYKEGLGGVSYRKLVEKLIKSEPLADEEAVRKAAAEYLGLNEEDDVIKRLSWLGIFSDELIPEGVRTPLNALNKLMVKKMQYEDNQKDLIVMHHIINYELNNKKYELTSSLRFEGEEEHNAMALTVGLPVAFTAKLVLEGELKGRGVMIPTTKEFYEPILTLLEEKNIRFVERIVEK